LTSVECIAVVEEKTTKEGNTESKSGQAGAMVGGEEEKGREPLEENI
jgi:hypothetical protein